MRRKVTRKHLTGGSEDTFRFHKKAAPVQEPTQTVPRLRSSRRYGNGLAKEFLGFCRVLERILVEFGESGVGLPIIWGEFDCFAIQLLRFGKLTAGSLNFAQAEIRLRFFRVLLQD